MHAMNAQTHACIDQQQRNIMHFMYSMCVAEAASAKIMWPWPLIFDPKTHHFIFAPRCANVKGLAKICQQIPRDIPETYILGQYLVMLWPWPLTFWPQNLINSSLSQDAPMTKAWQNSTTRYWRYRGNIKHIVSDTRPEAQTEACKTYSLWCLVYTWHRLNEWQWWWQWLTDKHNDDVNNTGTSLWSTSWIRVDHLSLSSLSRTMKLSNSWSVSSEDSKNFTILSIQLFHVDNSNQPCRISTRKTCTL